MYRLLYKKPAMKKDSIKTNVADYFKQSASLSKKTVKEFGEDEIHDFRVQIKKMRAYLRLLNTEFGEPPVLKMPKSIKRFYHDAGDVRNLQVQMEQIRNHCKKKLPAGYLDLLQKELDEGKQKMDSNLPSSSRLNYEKKKIIHALPHKLTRKNIEDFTLQKKGAMLNILNEEKTDERLHELRKMLKDLMYNEKLIKKVVNLDAFPLTRDIKALTQLLGDHQDLYMQLQFLQPAYLDKLDNPEKQELQHLSGLLEKRKKLLKKRILQKIK